MTMRLEVIDVTPEMAKHWFAAFTWLAFELLRRQP
jgi:hypothetical protein